jgi:hypothetical protein
MTTEERILAKMEQLKKEREDAAIEAAIEKEALRRLEKDAFQIEREKLEQAILYGDINTIREFAGRKSIVRTWRHNTIQTFWKGGCKITAFADKARKLLDERAAEQKRDAEEEQQRFRIAREAFDRAEKEAKLAAMPLDDLVLGIEGYKKSINQNMSWLSNHCGSSPMDAYNAQKNVTEWQSIVADYEAELNRRRVVDKALVEERIIQAPIEAKAAANSETARKRQRELATLGCGAGCYPST